MEQADVLVVEDRAAIRLLLQAGLGQAGLRVRTVGGASAALRAIRAAVPDVVIADLVLADGDGEGFIGALRHDPGTRDLPVIVLSGLPGAAEIGLRAGADECIPKPFDIAHLVCRVRFYVTTRSSAHV